MINHEDLSKHLKLCYFLSNFCGYFHQNVEQMNWECNTTFWEVFAYFQIGKGPIFCPRFGQGKSLSTGKRFKA